MGIEKDGDDVLAQKERKKKIREGRNRRQCPIFWGYVAITAYPEC